MMRWSLIILSCTLFHTLAIGQNASDRALLKEAYETLKEARNSFNLDPEYLAGELARADEKIRRVEDIHQIVEKDPAMAHLFNAEDFYIRFTVEQFNPAYFPDSASTYFLDAWNSVKIAKRNYIVDPGRYAFYGVQLQDIISLQDELRPYFGTYMLHAGNKSNTGRIMAPTHMAFDSKSLPAFKPYRYSAYNEIGLEYFKKNGNDPEKLGDIHQELTAALEKGGYDEYSYFSYPNGYVVVTQLEQIEEDGTPKPIDQRWSVSNKFEDWSLWNYLRALFTAYPAYYRVFAFVVSDHPVKADSYATMEELTKSVGANKLPVSLLEKPISPNHSCTVLVYEFEQRSAGKGPRLVTRSQHTGKTHLRRAKLWSEIID